MSNDAILQRLEDALRSRRLEVERIEDTFNISQGTGIMAHKTHVDPRPLIDEISGDEDEIRRQIAGYVSGVKHVLLEPSRSSADEWDFVESAGGLVPSLEVPTFGLGVEAAADEPAWCLDFDADLIVAYFIKLDRGIRVLTAPQVQRWGVSDDRITSGARSILFHKTRNLDFEPVQSVDGVHRLHSGDGHDAARCFVVGDAFYSEIDDSFRFGLPSPDHFLCIFDSDPDSVEQLSQAVEDVYHDVDYPLTTQLFRFQASKPVSITEQSHD